MLITKTIEVKVNHRNIKTLQKSLPKVEKGDMLNIHPSLLKGSHVKLDVECDYCKSSIKVNCYNYFKITKDFEKYACKNKECKWVRRKEKVNTLHGGNDGALEKRKKTNLKKYGTEWAGQTEQAKEKRKQTNLEKYGVEHVTQSKEFINRMQSTMLEKYGQKTPPRTEETIEKTKKTNRKKYGVDFPLQSKGIRDKIQKTVEEKYGVKSVMQLEEFRNKAQQTNTERYGAPYTFNSEEIRDKIKTTILKRYGVENISQSDVIKKKKADTSFKNSGAKNNTQAEVFRKRNYKIANHKDYLSYDKQRRTNVFKCDKNKEHTFEINSTQYFDRNKGNIPLCTVCNPIGDSTSIKQQDLSDFIKGHTDLEVLDNYRGFGKEIDIYLPELKLGYEFNGLYWHSEKFRDKYYHQDKTNLFKKEGIKIVHIWEDEWDNKKDIIKSQIKNSLKLSKVIFARKTKCKEVSKEESRKFLNENHLQGAYSRIKKTIGLFHKEELVSVMVFDHQEGRKNLSEDEWNLSRFCNKKNTTVVGGASKLLKTFLRNNSPKRIISYADADWSTGGLYENLGFTEVSRSRPDYKYVVEGKREHKSKWRKKKGQTKTEREIMQELGIERIYDCGKIKYEINTHKHNG